MDTPLSCLCVFFFQCDHIGLLISTEVVQVEEGDDQVSLACEPHTEGLPQNAPRRHEDTERLLDLHPQLPEVEVGVVLVLWQAFPSVRREQLLTDWVRRIPNDVVPVWNVLGFLCQGRLGPRRPIVRSPLSCDRDATDAIVLIAPRLYVEAVSRLAA